MATMGGATSAAHGDLPSCSTCGRASVRLHDPAITTVAIGERGRGVVVCVTCLGLALQRVGPPTRASLRVCAGDHSREDVNAHHGRYGIVASWPLRSVSATEPRIYACEPCLRAALDQVAAQRAA